MVGACMCVYVLCDFESHTHSVCVCVLCDIESQRFQKVIYTAFSSFQYYSEGAEHVYLDDGNQDLEKCLLSAGKESLERQHFIGGLPAL